MWEILGPLLGLGGLFVGSFLQKNREREKDRQDRRIEAYAKFLEIWAVSQRPDFGTLMRRMFALEQLTDQEMQFHTFVKERFDHAHSNLMIYGSKSVITALDELYSYAELEMSDESKAAHIRLLSAMRADGYSEEYPEFGTHVNNFMIDGPVERRLQLIQKTSLAQKSEHK